MQALKSSVDEEMALQGFVGEGSLLSKVRQALSYPVFRRGLYAGITVQVAQQFVGINTVMYYSPSIIQFAGFASNRTALALSLITSGLNAIGSIISMCFVDRYERRRLVITWCVVLFFLIPPACYIPSFYQFLFLISFLPRCRGQQNWNHLHVLVQRVHAPHSVSQLEGICQLSNFTQNWID